MSEIRSAERPAEAAKRQPRPDPEGIVFVDASWDVPQVYVPDPLIVRMFEELKNKRLVGARVRGGDRVIFPPQSVCEVSYRDTEELVEVGPAGTIRTFTIVHSKFARSPPPPYVIVFVQLDGASTATGGYLRNADVEIAGSLALIGKRAKAVFKDEPEGQWSDFWFELEG
ncbi:Zn-ribbon domain-containing OB-fold protein [Faunimonas sp. B44]|uniref:Zn-ribbon domain-containing OB-fold protein n=1 Tax=Faunimonas sp. B44 TaxID=3461493 RepID=UPI0040444264